MKMHKPDEMVGGPERRSKSHSKELFKEEVYATLLRPARASARGRKATVDHEVGHAHVRHVRWQPHVVCGSDRAAAVRLRRVLRSQPLSMSLSRAAWSATRPGGI